MTLTAEQVKKLEELGFKWKDSFCLGFYGNYIKRYGNYADKSYGELWVAIDGSFSIRCHSSVYPEIVADLAALKGVGL